MIARRKGGKPGGRKSGPEPRARNLTRSSRPRGTPAKRTAVDDDRWDDFKDEIGDLIRASINAPNASKLPPYDLPVSVLKREVYKFARSIEELPNGNRIFSAIEDDRDSGRRLRVDEHANPFHWVLFGLKHGKLAMPDELSISESDITRFSAQLLYAHRHKIEPELLIGFLMQTGSISHVVAKSRDVNAREAWYLAKQNPTAVLNDE